MLSLRLNNIKKLTFMVRSFVFFSPENSTSHQLTNRIQHSSPESIVGSRFNICNSEEQLQNYQTKTTKIHPTLNSNRTEINPILPRLYTSQLTLLQESYLGSMTILTHLRCRSFCLFTLEVRTFWLYTRVYYNSLLYVILFLCYLILYPSFPLSYSLAQYRQLSIWSSSYVYKRHQSTLIQDTIENYQSFGRNKLNIYSYHLSI